MTYNVFGGTLNLTQLHLVVYHLTSAVHLVTASSWDSVVITDIIFVVVFAVSSSIITILLVL